MAKRKPSTNYLLLVRWPEALDIFVTIIFLSVRQTEERHRTKCWHSKIKFNRFHICKGLFRNDSFLFPVLSESNFQRSEMGLEKQQTLADRQADIGLQAVRMVNHQVVVV